MLKALTIENIAVAKNINIDFNDGFTVLTGQTGAGKSVMVSAISMLLGGKIKKDLIRSGENEAIVSAIFDGEPDSGYFDHNGELIMERSISVDGKSRTKINGKSVPLSVFGECGATLISLHGQKETGIFYNKNEYLKFLDDYADSHSAIDEYKKIYSEIIKKRNEIMDLEESVKEKSMMVDILKYQISEIEKAKITSVDEEAKLEKYRTKLKSIEQINKNASFIYRALAPTEKGASVSYLLEMSIQALRRLSDVMDNADELATRLESYKIEITDIAEEAYAIIDEDITDPEKQLDMVESRLALFSRLKKKYGGDLSQIIDFKDNAINKLRNLESSDSKLEELNFDLKKLEKEALIKASVITELRQSAGKKLSDEVMKTLNYLDMPKVRFFVEIKKIKGDDVFTSTGIDDVDFMIVTNPGDDAHSLSTTASGGELSRIMLSLRSAMAEKSGTETIVFDEIDTGVSGSTSERIGIKLSELANKIQIICVTHSAQVAAHCDHHYLVSKNDIDGKFCTCVNEIFDKERVDEIARIIGGINVTEQQYKAALDLINNK